MRILLQLLILAALKPSDSGDGFVSGNGRVKATGNDDHPTRKQGLTAAVTLVRLTHLASTAPSTPKSVVETASERQQQWMFCDKAGISRELASKESTPPKTGNGLPAMIETNDLRDFQELPAGRQKLVETAIAVARNWPWLPYIYGGADPASGGFDCSGAMYYVMTRVGLTPPRTAAGQYFWLRDHERLRIVPDDATTADHSSLAWLRPGDLLFWSTDHPADHVKIVNITHVAMYLGREKRDGLQIMANATDGRSYRGTKANGYGVYELRLSREGSKSRLVGYGPPPGMTDIEKPAAPVQ
jgi:cell wall-associated NlpC family hydrolase